MLNWLKRLFGEKSQQDELKCSYCDGTKFYEGPSGGMSTNIMCADPACEHWFNYHQGIVPMDDLHMIGRDRRPG